MQKWRSIVLFTVLVLALVPHAFASGRADSEEVVIHWPCIWVGADAKAAVVADLVDAYNAENAGSIRVVIEEMPDYAVYDRKIVAEIASGSPPDFFTLKWNADTRAYYESDILMDFTDELAAGWVPAISRESIAQATIDGRVKVLPYETAITPIWYNTEIFDQAGIADFPATIDEMWGTFEKLKSIGVIPTSQMTGGNNAFTTQMWFSHLVNSIGGPDIWSKPFTDPAFVEAASILKQFFENGNTTADAIGATAGVSSGHYMAGRTAIFSNGPWFIGNIRSNAPDIYSVTAISPAPAAGPYTGSQVGFTLTAFAAANTNDAARRAAILDFIGYLALPENAKAISLESGSLLTPEFTLDAGENMDPLQAEFIKLRDSATFLGRRFDTTVPVSVLDEFGPGIDELVAGRISPEEFVARLEAVR